MPSDENTTPSHPATRPLNLRAPVALHERLRALVARVPALSVHRLALVALEHGLSAMERDPASALVRPAVAPDQPSSAVSPAPRKASPAPRRGEVRASRRGGDADGLRARYAAALEAGETHRALAAAAKTSDRTLRAWFKGERDLGPDTATRVAAMLSSRGL